MEEVEREIKMEKSRESQNRSELTLTFCFCMTFTYFFFAENLVQGIVEPAKLKVHEICLSSSPIFFASTINFLAQMEVFQG